MAPMLLLVLVLLGLASTKGSLDAPHKDSSSSFDAAVTLPSPAGARSNEAVGGIRAWRALASTILRLHPEQETGFASAGTNRRHSIARKSSSPVIQPRVLHRQSSPARTLRRLRTALMSTDEDAVAKLKEEVARLRAEAAEIESEQKARRMQALSVDFRKFDLNGDGKLDMPELKELSKSLLNQDVSDIIVEKLMKELDSNGDGFLQLDEFTELDVLQEKLRAISADARKEELAFESAERERKAEAEAKETLQKAINDGPPTISDRIISIIPFILPTLDGLAYIGELLPQDGATAVLFIAFALLRAIPFGGLIFFIALSVFSENLELNRLVRYNMKLAIGLDISLLIPSLLEFLTGPLADKVEPGVLTLAGGALLVPYYLAIFYCIGSSLLGIAPNKVPFLAEGIDMQVPTGEALLDYYELDAEGKAVRKMREGNPNDPPK